MEEESIVDYSVKINKTLNNEDLYSVEKKIRDFNKEVFKFTLNRECLNNLAIYIKDYVEYEHVIDTDFEKMMVELIKKVKPSEVKCYLNAICLLKITFKDENINFLKELLGYNKIYNIFKETIDEIFDKKIDHRLLALEIKLLDNTKLVYKNMKPMLSKLIKYVTNNLVEKNLIGCCVVISGMIESAPELFNEKLIVSILSYLVETLYTPMTYLYLKVQDCDEIVIACLHLLKYYHFSDKSFDRKSHLRGIFREVIGKISEYRNSTVFEEVLVVINLMKICPNMFKLYVDVGNDNMSFVKDVKKYLDVGFIKQNNDDNVDIKQNKEGIEFKNDDLKDTSLEPYKDIFLSQKYKYLDMIYPKCKVFDRNEFMEDVGSTERPVLILNQIKNLNEAIDWSDLIVVSSNGNSDFKLNFLKALFSDDNLNKREHNTIIKLFSENLDSESLIYFSKYACEKHCEFILFDLYFSNINSNDQSLMRSREIILEYLENNDVDLLYLDKNKESKVEGEIGFKNLLVLLLILAYKVKPIDEINTDHLKKIYEKETKTEDLIEDDFKSLDEKLDKKLNENINSDDNSKHSSEDKEDGNQKDESNSKHSNEDRKESVENDKEDVSSKDEKIHSQSNSDDQHENVSKEDKNEEIKNVSKESNISKEYESKNSNKEDENDSKEKNESKEKNDNIEKSIIFEEKINIDNCKKLREFIKQFTNENNPHHTYFVALQIYLYKGLNKKIASYFDMISDLLTMKLTEIEITEYYKLKSYNLILNMNSFQVSECSILAGVNYHSEYHDSIYIKKYLEILYLFEQNSKFNIESDDKNNTTKYSKEDAQIIIIK